MKAMGYAQQVIESISFNTSNGTLSWIGKKSGETSGSGSINIKEIKVNSSGHADSAGYADSAGSATKATNDGDNLKISTTYAKKSDLFYTLIQHLNNNNSFILSYGEKCFIIPLNTTSVTLTYTGGSAKTTGFQIITNNSTEQYVNKGVGFERQYTNYRNRKIYVADTLYSSQEQIGTDFGISQSSRQIHINITVNAECYVCFLER